MPEEYITIAEAARRLGKSEKTLRRMVHSGKLTARYPVPNRAEVAISDIEALLAPGHGVQTDTALEALEQRLARLERQVRELEARLAEASAPVAPVKATRQSVPASPLPGLDAPVASSVQDVPEGTVKVSDFVRAHGMKRETVKTQIEAGYLDAIAIDNPSRRDEKIRYFTREQQRQAVQVWQHNVHFSPCPQCPHA